MRSGLQNTHPNLLHITGVNMEKQLKKKRTEEHTEQKEENSNETLSNMVMESISSGFKENSQVKENATVEKYGEQEYTKMLGELYEWTVKPDKYPWMFNPPYGDSNVDKWAKDWADFTLHWFKFKKIHIASLSDIAEEKPFFYLKNKIESLRVIFRKLEALGLGYFIDEDNMLFRVKWRSIDEWCNIVYDWAFRRGQLSFSLLDLMRLKESPDNFHKLPVEDLKEIISRLVKYKRARWVKKEFFHIKLLI